MTCSPGKSKKITAKTHIHVHVVKQIKLVVGIFISESVKN